MINNNASIPNSGNMIPSISAGNENVGYNNVPQMNFQHNNLNNHENQQGFGIAQPNYQYPPMQQQNQMQPPQNSIPLQNIHLSNSNPQEQQKTDYYINFSMPKMEYQDSNIPKSLEPSQPNQHRNEMIENDEENQKRNHQNIQQNYQGTGSPYNAAVQYNQIQGYPQQHYNQSPYQPNMQMQNQNVNQYNPNYPNQYPNQQYNPYPNQPPNPYPNQYPNQPYPQNYNPQQQPFIANNQVKVELQDLKQLPQTQSQSLKDRPLRLSTIQKREGKRKKTYAKKNTINYAVAASSSNHVYLFIDTPGYHTHNCCCDLLFMDDCWIKWMCDLFFQLIYLPFRLLSLIFKGIGSICCKDSCHSCVDGFQSCFYSPFRCVGDWVNQCWFSCLNFCCQGIDFIPTTFSSLYTNCCQKMCLQCGQFFKNCCVFPIDCNCKCLQSCPDCASWCKNDKGDCCCFECCHDVGDCCFNLCSPQGCCEDLCNCCSKISCDCINSNCVSNCCSCCVEIKSIQLGEELVKIIECCFCFFIKTIGAVLEDVLK